MKTKKSAMDDFASLLDEQLNRFNKGFNPGDRVRGMVSNINHQYVTLDVNAKREGLVPLADVTNEDGTLRCAIGDTLEVIFAGMQNGAFMFSGSLDAKQVVDRTLSDAYERQLPVEGRVEKEINGGYEISIAGQRAFCPFSQINLFRQENAEYIGNNFNFLVTEYGADERGQNVILSRRALLEREREVRRQELVESLHPGMIVDGVVTRIVDFGVFVDLDGMEGLVPLRELDWERDTKPEDIVKPGDKVKVQIRELDWERGRISLSLRYAAGDPWDDAVVQFPVGSQLTGKVTKVERFGAFVRIIPGVEGLVPIGRLGRGRRLMSAREAASEGDELLVKIESVDLEQRRISLSLIDERLRSLHSGELKVGARVEGIVESIQPFGVFVRLSEDKTGLLHISECDISKGGNPAAKLERKFPPSEKVEVVVKSLEGSRVSLTLPDKWEQQGNSGEQDDVAAWMARKNEGHSLGNLGDAFANLNL